MNWPTDNLNTQCRKEVKNGATKIFLAQARDETDLQSELDSAKQEIAKLQDELIKAEAEKNKLRQQFNMLPMQKMLMQGKRARGEELDQEVSCFFSFIAIDHVLLPAGEQEEEGGGSKSGEAHRQMIQ